MKGSRGYTLSGDDSDMQQRRRGIWQHEAQVIGGGGVAYARYMHEDAWFDCSKVICRFTIHMSDGEDATKSRKKTITGATTTATIGAASLVQKNSTNETAYVVDYIILTPLREDTCKRLNMLSVSNLCYVATRIMS